MKLTKLLFIAVISLSFCAGCSSTPTAPKNVEQGIAYAYVAHATATQAVTSLLNSGKISVDVAENALVMSKQAKVTLDTAQKLVSQGKPEDAEAALNLANSAIDGIRKFTEASQK